MRESSHNNAIVAAIRGWLTTFFFRMESLRYHWLDQKTVTTSVTLFIMICLGPDEECLAYLDFIETDNLLKEGYESEVSIKPWRQRCGKRQIYS